MKAILQHLFNKDSLSEIPLETIDQFTRRYPFFAVGHFLLTKKLQEVNDSKLPEQFQKTFIYFHNPLWLQYQLSKSTDADVAEANNIIPLSSHDLIEDVVLHQELDFASYEEMPDNKTSVFYKPEIRFEQDPPLNKAYEREEQVVTDKAEIVEKKTESQSESENVTEGESALQPDTLNFQALHTVDYFASQGIKINNDINPDDKLGKQLKSFTEWLKTMRRLPEAMVQEVLQTTNDREVERYAANSLEEKEVLTEAMAEVLIKQGKQAKAKDVYSKLSLLNPHKSAYFAAKLEALKMH